MGYEDCIKYSTDPSRTKPLIQCEYAHAMGNSEGGFAEYWDIIRKYDKYQGGFIWDFVDQSVRWYDENGVMFYGYGGDFNRFDPSDANFCDNGLISPDRVPNPHMYEVGYYYQNIWTTLKDASDGTLEIYNENFFRDLSVYSLGWTLLKDGIAVRSGHLDNLNVPAQSRALVTIGTLPTDSSAEWLLNVEYALKEAEGLLPAGQIIARQQLELSAPAQKALTISNVAPVNVAAQAPVIDDSNSSWLAVRGVDFELLFSRRDGFLNSYCVAGTEYIQDGSRLAPNFWRAPTDNDFGAYLQMRQRAWNAPEMSLKSLDTHIEDGMAVVIAKYSMPAVSASLELTYTINNQGAILVNQKMTVDPEAQVADLFRFGMQLPMPSSFERVVYYGRGPIENYVDRKDCTFVGLYDQTVDEQFYPYIRPQENGNKSDLRWWKVLDASGSGLQFSSDKLFSASALHYTIESLDEGVQKTNRHSQLVPKSDVTNVLLDAAQMGLGCINPWGAVPREEYKLHYGDYEFNLLIRPVR